MPWKMWTMTVKRFFHSFRIVVCVTEMPRSAIMITRSRKLSLKLVYQLTHKR
jgi:hypothetical protein